MSHSPKIILESSKLYGTRNDAWRTICRDRSQGVMLDVSGYADITPFNAIYQDVTFWSASQFAGALSLIDLEVNVSDRLVKDCTRMNLLKIETWKLLCLDRTRGDKTPVSSYKNARTIRAMVVSISGWQPDDYRHALRSGDASAKSDTGNGWGNRGRVIRKGGSL